MGSTRMRTVSRRPINCASSNNFASEQTPCESSKLNANSSRDQRRQHACLPLTVADQVVPAECRVPKSTVLALSRSRTIRRSDSQFAIWQPQNGRAGRGKADVVSTSTVAVCACAFGVEATVAALYEENDPPACAAQHAPSLGGLASVCGRERLVRATDLAAGNHVPKFDLLL